MIIVYVTCKNKKEAEKIGLSLVKKRLAACAVVLPGAISYYWWPARFAGEVRPSALGRPPKKNKIERASEVILLAKTLKNKMGALELEVKKLHSYSIPAIVVLPVKHVNKEYLAWLKREIA